MAVTRKEFDELQKRLDETIKFFKRYKVKVDELYEWMELAQSGTFREFIKEIHEANEIIKQLKTWRNSQEKNST